MRNEYICVSVGVREGGGRGRGSELSSDLDPNPWKIRIDTYTLDAVPQHKSYASTSADKSRKYYFKIKTHFELLWRDMTLDGCYSRRVRFFPGFEVTDRQKEEFKKITYFYSCKGQCHDIFTNFVGKTNFIFVLCPYSS